MPAAAEQIVTGGCPWLNQATLVTSCLAELLFDAAGKGVEASERARLRLAS